MRINIFNMSEDNKLEIISFICDMLSFKYSMNYIFF